MNNDKVFAERFEIVLGTAKCETALSGVAVVPASGAFIDVTGADVVHAIVHLGTLHTTDTPVFTLKCAEAINGTLDVIDVTLAKTPDVDADDGQVLLWSLGVDMLPVDHHFVAMAQTGTLTNGSYADVLFLLEKYSQPVTQRTAVCPSDNQFVWVA